MCIFSGTLQPSIENLLLHNIRVLSQTLKSDVKFKPIQNAWETRELNLTTECSSGWKYVMYCLQGLSLLQESLVHSMRTYEQCIKSDSVSQSPEMSPDTLSFGEQKVVKGVVQFVVCLGICTKLDAGVGLPIELRTGYSEIVKLIGSPSDKQDNLSGSVQLFQCVKVLMTCVTCPALGTLILTQHLSDLLAVLLQLNHQGMLEHKLKREQSERRESKNSHEKLEAVDVSENDTRSACDNDRKSSEYNVTDGDSSTGSSESLTVDYVYCKHALDELVQKVYPPLLVNTLLVLQGGPKPKVSSEHILSSH